MAAVKISPKLFIWAALILALPSKQNMAQALNMVVLRDGCYYLGIQNNKPPGPRAWTAQIPGLSSVAVQAPQSSASKKWDTSYFFQDKFAFTVAQDAKEPFWRRGNPPDDVVALGVRYAQIFYTDCRAKIKAKGLHP